MNLQVDDIFAFEEGDHLVRIHLKLALEDLGFIVNETGDTISLAAEAAADPRRP